MTPISHSRYIAKLTSLAFSEAVKYSASVDDRVTQPPDLAFQEIGALQM
jgi:hypothetical protein